MRSLLALAKGASVEDAERAIIEELGPDTRQDLAYGVPKTRLVGRPALEEELDLLRSQPAHRARSGR